MSLAFTEVFVSELIGKLVIDKFGNRVGKVTDLLILPHESFPRVWGVEVKRGKENIVITDNYIAMLNKQIVSLNLLRGEETTTAIPNNVLFLKRDLLDRQIVDINGAKVVRVNDLKITQVNEEYRLLAVDIGFRGLIRRLGAERPLLQLGHWLGVNIPEKLVTWDYVEFITADLSSIKLSISQGKLAELHPYDIAQIVSKLGAKERSAIFQSFDDETAAETLAEMEGDVQAAILEGMSKDRAADILEIMASDDAADVLKELPTAKADEILQLMEREEAEDVQELRAYDEDEAGSLMTTEYVALPEELSAEETINRLREQAPEAETIYYIYVVDGNEQLTGVLSLRELIIAKPETKLRHIMQSKVMSVRDEAPIEDAIAMIRKYDLLVVPVVDNSEKIIGIITVDDVIDAVIPRRRRNLLKFS